MRTVIVFVLLAVAASVCDAQWATQSSGTTSNLCAASFIDLNNGMAVGDSGTILRTTNGGLTWGRQPSGTRNNLNGVFFKDVKFGWVVGDSGTILKTTNGGVDWLKQTVGTQPDLHSVCFTDSTSGWVVGGYNESYDTLSGIILHTTNGGTNWSLQANGNGFTFSDVCFTGANTGIAVGGGPTMNGWWSKVLRTTDGGEHWTDIPFTGGGFLLGIDYVEANVWVAVGKSGGFPHGPIHAICRTTDGGITWIVSLTTLTYGTLDNVEFTDANNGWAVGAHGFLGGGGTILSTTDGGQNWISQVSGTSKEIRGISFTDASNGTAVADSGTILRTTNGGLTFVEPSRTREVPSYFTLQHNYPNPFNPTTTINYQIPKQADVKLTIVDVLGREVATLVNEVKQPGTYTVQWDALSLASGVYFYRLQAGTFVATKKLVVLR